MLTRSRLQHGEGELEEFDPEIGSIRGRMDSPKGEDGASSIPSEGEFLKALMRMQTMVEEIMNTERRVDKVAHLILKVKEKKVVRTLLKLHHLHHLILMVLYILHLKSKRN